jgi:hypothetical protein
MRIATALLAVFLFASPLAAVEVASASYSAEQLSEQSITTFEGLLAHHFAGASTMPSIDNAMLLVDGRRAPAGLAELPAHEAVELLTNGKSVVINVITAKTE